MFQTSGVECKVIENLLHGRWENSLEHSIQRPRHGHESFPPIQLLATTSGTELVIALMTEAMSIAAKLNFHWPAILSRKAGDDPQNGGV